MSKRHMTVQEVLAELRAMESPRNREGMARFGINTGSALGIKVTDLRKFARFIQKDHNLARDLWKSGIHEARILAAIVADHKRISREEIEEWARDFNSWDLVDQTCNNLIRKTEFAHDLALEWSGREEEFIRRAGFSLMAVLAVHDKGAPDGVFENYLAVIETGAGDERNFVMKSVNWALRQIGKRSPYLGKKAINCAEKIKEQETKNARWIASNALRELKKMNRKSQLG